MKLKPESGFSLVELIVSFTILFFVAGIALTALVASQRIYTSQQSQVDMHAGLRGAFELLTQEIGQAGAINFTPTTLAHDIHGGSSVQDAPMSSTSNIFVGEKLIVDTGSSQETVSVTSVDATKIRAIFSNDHLNGAVVAARGVLPQGILSSSTATSLQIVGDVNADGTLAYVQYDCDTAAGTLTRSATTIAPGVTSRNTAQTLLTNLVANPGGNPCFQYATSVSASGFTFIPSVAVSLTVQTSQRDSQTGQFVTMTKSFSNLSSRNILAGLAMAQASPAVTNRLQPAPAGLPLGP